MKKCGPRKNNDGKNNSKFLIERKKFEKTKYSNVLEKTKQTKALNFDKKYLFDSKFIILKM